MARRPDMQASPRPMSAEQLKQFRERLVKLTPHHVRIEYQSVYQDCRMFGEELPPPAAVQQLVQIYKQLWKWRRRRN